MSLFAQIASAVVFASVFGAAARLLRQPLILGYLLAGFVIVALGVVKIDNPQVLQVLGKLGVTFLLFLVGLEMNFGEIRSLGRVVILTGIAQIFIIASVGFLAASLLGFLPLSSLYIGVILSFPSTIIAVKFLSEKKDLASLYGKLAVGLLLVEDFVAIAILIFLSGFKDGITPLGFTFAVGKGIVLVGLVLVASQKVLPKIFDKLAQSPELLFISSIAWALGVAAIMGSHYIGFSQEMGGFLAGLALANSVGHLQIASRVRPLRDFFLTIFFLILGAELVISGVGDIVLPVLVFSFLVLLGNPLIIIIMLGLQGFHRRTSFLTALNFGQVFEFSFIVIAMGRSLGHVGQQEVAVVTFIGVVTVTASSLLYSRAGKAYATLGNYLKVFERRRTKESALGKRVIDKNHIILVGCDRTGMSLLPALSKQDGRLVVVDFNPNVIEKLRADGYEAMYGDIADSETLELLNIPEAKLIVSTVGNLEDNLLLLENIRTLKDKPAVVFVASSAHDAIKFYEAGADYVIVPQVVGGEHLGHIINAHGTDKSSFEKLKDKHFDRLAKERYLV